MSENLLLINFELYQLKLNERMGLIAQNLSSKHYFLVPKTIFQTYSYSGERNFSWDR